MAKKAEQVVPEIIDSVEGLNAKMAAMREAQKVFATYTQEQVDKIFFAAASAANKMRIPLAKMAVEETGMGIVEKSTIAAAKVVLDAAVAAGAPEGIIGWIDVPSLDLTNEVMRDADIILATGGPGMVKAAYSSGKPALGVGAGNTPVIIDDTADVRMAVNSIIHSKTFDNGTVCASEQSIIVKTR